jgi:hypothetical protein
MESISSLLLTYSHTRGILGSHLFYRRIPFQIPFSFLVSPNTRNPIRRATAAIAAPEWIEAASPGAHPKEVWMTCVEEKNHVQPLAEVRTRAGAGAEEAWAHPKYAQPASIRKLTNI